MGKRPGRERWGWPHSLQVPMVSIDDVMVR